MPFSVLFMSILIHIAHSDGNGSEGGPSSVFQHFPVNAEAYRPEVAALVREGVVERFGEEEWAAVVVSHEVHQHIGIYTVIGAKMGVRARELLEAPRRSVQVVIRTTPRTPMACTTDGLQVALGSTYGQDLIRIETVAPPGLDVEFMYEHRRLIMRLTPEYSQRVRALIDEAIEKHGFLTPVYFEAVRAASYRVWAEWDRKEIFVEEVVEGQSETK